MARHPNRVIPHSELLAAIWGANAVEHPEYLRVFVGLLRRKVEPNPSEPQYLVTEPWVGYRFNPDGGRSHEPSQERDARRPGAPDFSTPAVDARTSASSSTVKTVETSAD